MQRFTDEEAASLVKAVALGWFWPFLYKYVFFGLVWAFGNLLVSFGGESTAEGRELVSAVADLAGYAGFFLGTMVGATVFVALTGRAWLRVLSAPPSPTRRGPSGASARP